MTINLLDWPTGREFRALAVALLASRTAAMTVLFGRDRYVATRLFPRPEMYGQSQTTRNLCVFTSVTAGDEIDHA